MELAGMKRAMTGIDQAAEIGVAADLASLLGTGDDLDRHLEALRLALGQFGQGLELFWVMGGVESTSPRPVAIQSLTIDQPTDIIERLEAFAPNAESQLLVMAARQGIENRLDAGRDPPAIAAGKTPAGPPGIAHHLGSARLGGLLPRPPTGLARSPHQHVD